MSKTPKVTRIYNRQKESPGRRGRISATAKTPINESGHTRNQRQLQLANDPRVIEPRKRNWERWRSRAKDDVFRDETQKVKSGLETAYAFAPIEVDEFLDRIWYPTPTVYAAALRFLENIHGVTLRSALLRYLRYASRFGVYMVRTMNARRTKFQVHGIVPRGDRFRVRVVGNHLEPFYGTLKNQPFIDSFADDRLTVPDELKEGSGSFRRLGTRNLTILLWNFSRVAQCKVKRTRRKEKGFSYLSIFQ